MTCNAALAVEATALLSGRLYTEAVTEGTMAGAKRWFGFR